MGVASVVAEGCGWWDRRAGLASSKHNREGGPVSLLWHECGAGKKWGQCCWRSCGLSEVVKKCVVESSLL